MAFTYPQHGKRLIDLLIAGLLGLLAAPAMLLVALAIRVFLGRPVLFTQLRPGLDGKLFKLTKFRTMTDAREEAGNRLPDAQRLSRFGRILRASSLDELPELWNVLRGDMSLVGPRPLLPEYLPRYSPHQMRRHEVRPGITGWAQVNGRNNIAWEKKFAFDVWYVDHCCFLLDVKILLLTAFYVLRRKGINQDGCATMPPFTPRPLGNNARNDDTADASEVIVLGAGGHAKVVISTLRAAGREIAAVYDDDPLTHGTRVLGVEVRGAITSLPRNHPGNAILAIGDAAQRRAIVDRHQFHWVSVIHPAAWVDPSARIGEGAIVCAGAVIQPDCRIGQHAIINTSSSVDHDCHLGDFVHIGPGARLAGGVSVADSTLLGTQSCVIPGVKIGRETTVGAGAVVVDDLPDAVVAAGCPAKVMKRLDDISAPASWKQKREATIPHISSVPDTRQPNTPALPFTAFAPWPMLDEEMIDAANRVLRSGKLNYWTGTEGRQFEREFADHVGCRHAVALANGTVALELALVALGIGPGDEVIVPSRTFVATASAVARCGARPVFADIDRESQNITANTIRDQLTSRTKAIIAVHLAGWPCDMDPIIELARQHGLLIIEDCAQAHGARYKGRVVGSLGDVGAYSFCQDKIVTTAGEGGMLVTNRRDVWERAWSFKDHGKNHKDAHRQTPSTGFRWLHDEIGTNWRLTEVQSAIGRVALRKLCEWVASRRRHAACLEKSFDQIPALRVTRPPDGFGHSYYKYYAFVRPAQLQSGWNRDRIQSAIHAAGIPCFSGSCSEIYLERAFPETWRPGSRHPIAKELGATSLMFLVHPTLTRDHFRATIMFVESVMREASLPDADCVQYPHRQVA
jgi:sugar O-acyltransferase (sialic acid O-acetyltransferase NeuD family)